MEPSDISPGGLGGATGCPGEGYHNNQVWRPNYQRAWELTISHISHGRYASAT